MPSQARGVDALGQGGAPDQMGGMLGLIGIMHL
jgi:hypothetical protein